MSKTNKGRSAAAQKRHEERAEKFKTYHHVHPSFSGADQTARHNVLLIHQVANGKSRDEVLNDVIFDVNAEDN